MHKLSQPSVSVDSSVVIDFHVTKSLPLFEALFEGRMLMSDLVEHELAASDLRLASAQTSLIEDAEWKFLEDLKKTRPGLGKGELGAITVAKFRKSILLTNDRQARQAADEMNVQVSGAIGVLEYAAEANKIVPEDAVKLLQDMIRAGAWISEDLVEMFEGKWLKPPTKRIKTAGRAGTSSAISTLAFLRADWL